MDAYLESLMFYGGMKPQNISILYSDSPQFSYKALVAKYPTVNWVRETDFYSDLLSLVKAADNYILFGCDDVFFTDHFDPSAALDRLVSDQSLFGFSLRLGLNLHSLPDLKKFGDVIEWNWMSSSTGHWRYPWDVSASIYRKLFVLDYLSATPSAINPNRFESLLAEAIEGNFVTLPERLASFDRSKCLTLTVNRVQDEFPNDYDASRETDIQALYRAHVAGKQLDWGAQYRVQNSVIHVDATYFSLCDAVQRPKVDFIVSETDNAAVLWLDTRVLRLRIFFWRYIVAFKEWLRPHVPRRVMPMLRKLMRMG